MNTKTRELYFNTNYGDDDCLENAHTHIQATSHIILACTNRIQEIDDKSAFDLNCFISYLLNDISSGLEKLHEEKGLIRCVH